MSGSSNTLVGFYEHSLAHGEFQPSSEVPNSLSLVTWNEVEDQTGTAFWKPDRGWP